MKRAFALAALSALVLVPACDSWPGLGGAGGSDASFASGGTQIDDSTGDVGSSCGATAAACQTGLTCDTSYPNGLCTKTCASSADCLGGVCVIQTSFQCFKACTTSATCRTGYSCQDLGFGPACLPGDAPSGAGGGLGALGSGGGTTF